MLLAEVPSKNVTFAVKSTLSFAKIAFLDEKVSIFNSGLMYSDIVMELESISTSPTYDLR